MLEIAKKKEEVSVCIQDEKLPKEKLEEFLSNFCQRSTYDSGIILENTNLEDVMGIVLEKVHVCNEADFISNPGEVFSFASTLVKKNADTEWSRELTITEWTSDHRVEIKIV